MKSSKLLYVLILTMLSWTTAGHAAMPSNPPIFKAGEKQARGSLARVNWRWVGLRREGVPCPEIAGWEKKDWLQESFESVNPRPSEPYELVNPEPDRVILDEAGYQKALEDPLLQKLGLDRFCVYNRLSTSAEFPQKLPAGLVKALPDRMAMIAAGPVEPDLSQTLAGHFLIQSGKRLPADLQNLQTDAELVHLSGPPSVRLVFLDTQPDGEGVPVYNADLPSRHGYTLANLAQQLVCSDLQGSTVADDPSHCAAAIATGLALPHTRFEPDGPPSEPLAANHGGDLGLVDELAVAIVKAVWHWRESNSKQHLILNLSLGWDSELLDELDQRSVSRLEPSTQLVYDALRFARQSNVLVIAAAGNRQGGSKASSWPLLPAAWELRRPSFLPFLFLHKPVYAVGGADSQGLPLPNSRLGGTPRRVAYGDHSVTETGDHDLPAVYTTGTSVSTAVVSSIAAVVWHLRPELRPDQVMRLISRSGDPLARRADFYALKGLWPPELAPHAKRLSLCQAVVQACRSGEGRCASIPKCPRWERNSALLSAFYNSNATALPELKVLLPNVCKASRGAPGLWLAKGDSTSADLCPVDLLPDIVSQRWVAPQPENTPCPGCSIIPPPGGGAAGAVAPASLTSTGPSGAKSYVLTFEIDPKWRNPLNVAIMRATLDIDRYAAGKFIARMTYAIPLSVVATLQNPLAQRFSMVGIDGITLADCTATFNFEVSVKDEKGEMHSFSVQSPVYIGTSGPNLQMSGKERGGESQGSP